MKTVKIRDAGVTDIPAITTLLAQLGYPDTEETVRSRFNAVLTTGSKVLLAQSDGIVLGLAALDCTRHLHRPPDGRLTALVVAADYRHAGIGKRLLEATEVVFRDWGCARAELSSGGRRADAHRFFRREGYVEAPKRFRKSLANADSVI
jgi:N-acetylglutamate synthase-like GNAT family acetyltransferase